MRRVFIDLSNDSHLCQPSVFGGYAGEHNETQLEVKLPKRMVEIDCSGYYFDFQTADDKEILSPLLPPSYVVDNIISFKLSEQLTVAGKLKFNIKAISKNHDIVDLISKTNIAILHIDCSPEGTPTDINPENCKDEFFAMIEAIVAEMIKGGEGNITVNLPIDTTYSSVSNNAPSGRALAPIFNAKQDKLISGENIKTINGQSVLGEGDIEISGGTGGNITVDQTYNPESENPQSGKAVAPVFQKKVEVWLPNTEYKVNDTVLAFVREEVNYGDGKPYIRIVTVGMVCLQNHVSPSDLEYPNEQENFNDYWSVFPFDARSSERDVNGNVIHRTYATKEEFNSNNAVLNNKINALISEKLSREIVYSLPNEYERDTNIIYMIQSNTASSNNVYEEYLVIEKEYRYCYVENVPAKVYTDDTFSEEITDYTAIIDPSDLYVIYYDSVGKYMLLNQKDGKAIVINGADIDDTTKEVLDSIHNVGGQAWKFHGNLYFNINMFEYIDITEFVRDLELIGSTEVDLSNYVTKEELGDIETALDEIIELQNSIIGE